MADYRAPLADIGFVLDHLVDLPALAALDDFAHLDLGTVPAVLEEHARFVEEVVAPLDAVGDREGATLDPATGEVATATGFRQAYARFVEAGWGAVPFDPAVGGGGFPWVVGLALQELMSSANLAFSLAPLLTQGAIEMLAHHGSDAQRATYLPRMVSGEWTGTMNLTEPQAGSDLGAVAARAVPHGDGTYRLTGTKIFITYGEHDLADNIVHLVLARTPGSPPGTKGISCFIVPKVLVGPDGSLGARNDVRCVSLERKMGIHASPTCTMSYGEEGGAVAELVGEEGAGMAQMFTMMNTARLSVGLQGLAVGERATQAALAHARERRQGRAPGAPPGERSPIVEHPDVRRTLLAMRAQVEAMRILAYTCAEAFDRSEHDPDPDVRAAQRERVDVLIPLVKAWCTDTGIEIASQAIQVAGGTGFIEESGFPQRLRDVRIAAIYEGTNGIQAIDLVGRKLGLRGGAAVADLLAEVAALDATLSEAGEELDATRHHLAGALNVVTRTTGWLAERGADDPRDVLAGATPYLRMVALVVAGWGMARQAVAARAALAGGGHDGPAAEALAARVATARFFCEQLLPVVHGLEAAATAGWAPLGAVAPDALDDRGGAR